MKHFATEVNPITGAREDYYWDEQEQTLTQRTRYDVTDVLESNKAQQANSIDKRYGKEMLHHVAEIPMGVVLKWKKEHGVDLFSPDPDMKRKVRRLLNDPEYRYLRTNNKRL
jgi:hypothetical protein